MSSLQKIVNCILVIELILGNTFAVRKDLAYNYAVEWNQVGNDTIAFQLTVDIQFPGYIGFGISNNGGMGGADIVAIVINSNGTATLKDMHGVGNTRPVLDKMQNYKLENVQRNGTVFRVKFSRLIDTCDPEDVEISMGNTQYILHSWGTINSTNMEINYHQGNRGATAVNLLDPTYKLADLSSYKVWELHQNIRLTTADTLYWCKIHRAPPLEKKHHIIGFRVNLDDEPFAKKHTHHASVLSCTAPVGENAETYFSQYLNDTGFDCYYSTSAAHSALVSNCKSFDFQWAYGGTTTVFPENVGVPLGESGGPMFYMTMLHLNNPERMPRVSFNSGFDIYYTEKLRSEDVGFFQIGINSTKGFTLTVPPNSSDYVLSSHCPAECTRGIPSEGVNVFVYLLHFHLTGRKMKVRHFRNGVELPWLANDENYDTSYQNNRMLRHQVKILPMDHLTVECTYNSMDRNGSVVLGGRSIMDEMCQAFLMYYPKIKGLNRCGSSVSQKEMLRFMGIDDIILPRADNDPIVRTPIKWDGLRYSHVVAKEIPWNMETRWAYQQMTKYNYHEAECTFLGKGVSVSAKYPKLLPQGEYVPLDKCKKGGQTTLKPTTAAASVTQVFGRFKIISSIVLLTIFWN